MNSSHGTKSKERRLKALAAARFRSEGHTQNEIALRLDTSQPEVSRLLDDATAYGFFNPHPTLQRKSIKDDEWDEVDQIYFIDRDLVNQLRARTPRGLHFDARVFPSDGEFAYRAAGRVAQLLQRARRVGVMWGRTLLRVMDEIASRWALPKGAKPPLIDCLPLCGDPVYLMNQRDMEKSASHLAATLEVALTGARNPALPCLIGVPAYIASPILHQGETRHSDLWAFIRRIPGYEAIFTKGGPSGKAWVEGIDTILTGVGIIGTEKEQSWDEIGDFIQERLAQEGLPKTTLKDLIYGDIGGLLLERKGLKTEDQKLVERLNQGWTGIKEAHLQAVARKATPQGLPGIILVAIGAAKAEMIDEILRRGFVNELLIDEDLALALKALNAQR